jgi:hypothetical protein
MKDQIRGTCRSSVFLVILVLCGWSCQAAPRLPPRRSASLVESGPCCEREQVHDLYAAPYRLAPR